MPVFFKQLGNLMKDFPLWTGVMIPLFCSKYPHASSACVESHFCNRKNRMLSKYGRPIRADWYVKIEIADQDGCAKLMNSKLVECTQKYDESEDKQKLSPLVETASDHSNDSDFMSFENWRNRADLPKKEKSLSDADCKYMMLN